mgnify:CR=1 FL=1
MKYRAVGRGVSSKSFRPWFVNRGAWCAAKGSRFFAARGARRGGGAFFPRIVILVLFIRALCVMIQPSHINGSLENENYHARNRVKTEKKHGTT